MENLIKNYKLYKKIIYFATLTLTILSIVRSSISSGFVAFIVLFVLVSICLADMFLVNFEFRQSLSNSTINIIYVIELFACNIIESFLFDDLTVFVPFAFLSFLISLEYMINDIEYDNLELPLKRTIILISLVANVIRLSIDYNGETEIIYYILILLVWYITLIFVCDYIIGQNKKFEKEKLKLVLDISDIERTNQELVEYQEKVKSINEQINYQKIDLARVVKELGQANKEIESQTKLMQYMASTFNVNKCMNVISDSIMDVKKPKFCAIYIDTDVFMNKYPSIVIKTNYTSMQNRLNKDFYKIFSSFCDGDRETVIYRNSEVRNFRFIGECNINSMVILPISKGEKLCGILIAGSDKSDFFDGGLNYYESCIVEFNVALKSTHLYLQMQDMARKDGLTGIFNRLYFKELFREASQTATINKSPLSVALFDIDKFKKVNDTYGHLAGDEVIKMVASTGQRFAEMHDGFACRYGGEEFLLVLPGKGSDESLGILEELHVSIKNTIVTYNDVDISVNVCIGLSSYPDICNDTELLVARADKAMYYGKENGRGRLVLDGPFLDNISN